MRKNHIIEMDNFQCNIIKYCKVVLHIRRKLNTKCKALRSKDEIKNSNVKIILEGEEIFIYRVVTPKVSKSKLYLIIRNEMIKKFHNIENIVYDYRVFSKTKQGIEVYVYCINASSLPLLNKELFHKANIKSVDTIQQIYIDYCNKKIRDKSYVLLVNKGRYIYILNIKENVLIKNRTLNYFDNDVKLEVLECFKEIYNCDNEVKTIYILSENKYEFVKLAKINEIEKLLKSSIFMESIKNNDDEKEFLFNNYNELKY